MSGIVVLYVDGGRVSTKIELGIAVWGTFAVEPVRERGRKSLLVVAGHMIEFVDPNTAALSAARNSCP